MTSQNKEPEVPVVQLMERVPLVAGLVDRAMSALNGRYDSSGMVMAAWMLVQWTAIGVI